MPYKNDDLDKLLRKAARDFPLNTDSADWNDLATKLQNSKKTPGNTKWKYNIVFLLLAIVIGSLVIYKFNRTMIPQDDKSTMKQVAVKKSPPGNNIKKVEAPWAYTDNKETIAGRKAGSVNKIHLNAKNNSIETANNSIANMQVENFEIVTTTNDAGNNPKQPFALEMNNKAAVKTLAGIKQLKLEKENSFAGQTKKADQSIKIDLKPEKRIYGLAYSGPEFSTVKYQKATTPGFRIGVALGYKINNKLNVEIGLQREHLNFYSTGKYVDTTQLRIRKETEVEKLNASSKITSVPLTVRYNFSSKGNGHFFVATGINAVIITHKERYNYAVSKNGIKDNLSKKYNALTTPKYFSGFKVSAGYQTKIYNSWSMKVEPYYQTPLKNFGVGKIPVTNFGIDIGIVKDLK